MWAMDINLEVFLESHLLGKYLYYGDEWQLITKVELGWESEQGAAREFGLSMGLANGTWTWQYPLAKTLRLDVLDSPPSYSQPPRQLDQMPGVDQQSDTTQQT